MPTLPTGVFANWSVTSLLESLKSALSSDSNSKELRLCYYGATTNGWDQIKSDVFKWRGRTSGVVTAIVGTDHALTDPDCLDELLNGGISLRLMVNYTGVFHPKLAWLTSTELQQIWIASNNLTEDGLLHNIELASVISIKGQRSGLEEWYNELTKGSVPATRELIASYRKERDKFGKDQAKVGTFTWSGRTSGQSKAPVKRSRFPKASYTSRLDATKGDLIIEIMRQETGTNGKQVQLPLSVATKFFGLSPTPRSRISVRLSNIPSGEPRTLTMSLFSNSTTRLSLRELEYRHRPCVCVFRKTASGFVYEIVPRAIYPERYKSLLAVCRRPTRDGSRRFGIVT